MQVRLDADLDTMKERFTCRGCGAKKPSVWSMSTPMAQDDGEGRQVAAPRDQNEDFDFLIDFS